jgi:multimeric flavodoxin WrbA
MKVLTAYYSRYNSHILKMARAVEEGVKSAGGVDSVLRRIEEFPEIEEGIDKKHPGLHT